ncbi:MAG: hypothetical protein AAFQ51_09250 [Pseudomonadota bacterium]
MLRLLLINTVCLAALIAATAYLLPGSVYTLSGLFILFYMLVTVWAGIRRLRRK